MMSKSTMKSLVLVSYFLHISALLPSQPKRSCSIKQPPLSTCRSSLYRQRTAQRFRRDSGIVASGFDDLNRDLTKAMRQIPIGSVISTLGLFWIITHPMFLFNVIFVLPLTLVAGYTLYTQLTYTEASCPVCSNVVTGLQSDEFPCSICGSQLKSEDGRFVTAGPVASGSNNFYGGGNVWAKEDIGSSKGVIDVEVEK
uniref:Uncharacterized protein n=1 Tax=Octactis speculum TaxID=3111310 RepID=A0A7S2FXQ2_9STRA